MSDKAKSTISITVVISICTILVGIIFTFFQMLRSADVQASSDRDVQLGKRVDNLEKIQGDITELKLGQVQIMTSLGIKNKIRP